MRSSHVRSRNHNTTGPVTERNTAAHLLFYKTAAVAGGVKDTRTEQWCSGSSEGDSRSCVQLFVHVSQLFRTHEHAYEDVRCATEPNAKVILQ